MMALLVLVAIRGARKFVRQRSALLSQEAESRIKRKMRRKAEMVESKREEEVSRRAQRISSTESVGVSLFRPVTVEWRMDSGLRMNAVTVCCSQLNAIRSPLRLLNSGASATRIRLPVATDPHLVIKSGSSYPGYWVTFSSIF